VPESRDDATIKAPEVGKQPEAVTSTATPLPEPAISPVEPDLTAAEADDTVEDETRNKAAQPHEPQHSEDSIAASGEVKAQQEADESHVDDPSEV
jgi:hypothetical protein